MGDDVMLLDSGDEVYLWIGEDSEAEEASRGRDLAKQYLTADPTSRYVELEIFIVSTIINSILIRNADNSLIITIKQNQEPDSFKMLFEIWE